MMLLIHGGGSGVRERRPPKRVFCNTLVHIAILKLIKTIMKVPTATRARYTCALELKIVAQKDWLKTAVVHLNNIKRVWRNPE